MRAYIGLGSNLADPQHQILTAIDDIDAIENTSLVARSSLYRSPPMGPQDQPDYINAVVSIETTLTPHELLDALQQIEQKHGRIRKRHWGERTLDLDILLYADRVIEDTRLSVPHPGIAERAFVVYPLAEIAPSLQIPGLGSLATIKAHCPQEGLEPLESNQS
jgi:2-amino-4-hydroxy-6-hydroxymethyldihydropteridine diphosphokinase